MLRHQLEHVIRAAGAIVDDDIVVIGSAAVLAEHPEPPAAMTRSIEADVYPVREPARAIVIDGAIGEFSPFHEQFGYYAHGVGPETAKAPEGWRDRLVALQNENTRGVTGWCLETHDLVLSKCVANRERDWEFAAGALQHELVVMDVLRSRLASLPIEPRDRSRIEERLLALGG